MVNKFTHSVNKDYWLKSLDTKSLEPTNQSLIKVPKVFVQWMGSFGKP